MSFRLFIYYCALCGGWAALAAFALIQLAGLRSLSSEVLRTTLVAGLLGLLLAGAVGTLDALLNVAGGQRLAQALVCLGVGLVSGLLAGYLGALLREYLSLPRFLGWMIVGTVIGASIGVYDLGRALNAGSGFSLARRKVLNGVVGGAIGGLVGGLLFEELQNISTLPRSSLAIGLVILGGCIGLLIGLAQIILKEAWIKIEAGFRAGREMILSKAETTIGRAESSDIGLFGDSALDRTHARIMLQGNRYILADAGSGRGTWLNNERLAGPTPLRSGDTIRVGNSVLRFGERRKPSSP